MSKTIAAGTDQTSAASICMDAYQPLRDAWRHQTVPTYAQRRNDLDRLRKWILDHQDDIIQAISADFNGRSSHETLMCEVLIANNSIKHTLSHLKAWMRKQPKSVYWAFLPARAKIVRQPLGVVGIIAPWNYPFQLAVVPLIAAIAAGNRVLIKPSELTPNTSALIQRMTSAVFAKDQVCVVQGAADVGAAFSALPLDHLFYTGSTHVGRLVMKAAADNLTPVTLELGGKSPAIIHSDFSLKKAAARIGAGKLLNAGQTCISPDYVLMETARIPDFVDAFTTWVTTAYPSIFDNDDYTAVINARHKHRIEALLEDAAQKGAQVIAINPANEDIPESTPKLLPTLVLNVSDDMDIMKEEIFGPVLPVKGIESVSDALMYVNDRPRPLALYYFDSNSKRVRRVLTETTSGGVVINDVIFHVAQENLPFGGVGASGTGSYHGEVGFVTFSHEKAVMTQSELAFTHLFTPPYGKVINTILAALNR